MEEHHHALRPALLQMPAEGPWAWGMTGEHSSPQYPPPACHTAPKVHPEESFTQLAQSALGSRCLPCPGSDAPAHAPAAIQSLEVSWGSGSGPPTSFLPRPQPKLQPQALSLPPAPPAFVELGPLTTPSSFSSCPRVKSRVLTVAFKPLPLSVIPLWPYNPCCFSRHAFALPPCWPLPGPQDTPAPTVFPGGTSSSRSTMS